VFDGFVCARGSDYVLCYYCCAVVVVVLLFLTVVGTRRLNSAEQ
jgi:hypothetical protein